MQTQEDYSNPIQALNVDSLKVDFVVIQNTCSEKEDSNSETTSSKSVMESSLNSETKDMHVIKYKILKAKERCMTYFRSLHSLLGIKGFDKVYTAGSTPSIASVPKEGPSIQGLLEWYGYDTIEEYLEDTFFPITDKDSTDEDTIHESYSPKSKERFHMEADHVVVEAESILGSLICKHLQKAFALLEAIAFATSIYNKHLLCYKLVCCKLLHLQRLQLHLQLAFALQLVFAEII
ncbi:hypothetical protein Tco_0816552 [Tanacetum coccineum]